MNDYKKGQTIVITSGEYSDYCITAVFRYLEDVSWETLNKIAAQVNALHQMEKEDEGFSSTSVQDKFLAALVRSQFIEEVDIPELHIGSYSQLELTQR